MSRKTDKNYLKFISYSKKIEIKENKKTISHIYNYSLKNYIIIFERKEHISERYNFSTSSWKNNGIYYVSLKHLISDINSIIKK